MFRDTHDFLAVHLRLLIAIAIVLGIFFGISIAKAEASEIRTVKYSAAFPKPIGPAKAKPIKFVWTIAATYRSAARPDTCRFVDTGERGRISILRTVQNPFDPGEYAWVGTDVMSDEAAVEACMAHIDPSKVEGERKYAHQ